MTTGGSATVFERGEEGTPMRNVSLVTRLACGALLVLAAIVPACCPPRAPLPSAEREELDAIELLPSLKGVGQGERKLTALPNDPEEALDLRARIALFRSMAQWSAEFRRRTRVVRDRDVNEPEGAGKARKPVDPNAFYWRLMNVGAEADYWLDGVLLPKWVPEKMAEVHEHHGYEESEHAWLFLQAPKPADSRVACRYRLGGAAIQMVQASGCCCLIIRPPADFRWRYGGKPTLRYGCRVMGAFLRNGSSIARLPMAALFKDDAVVFGTTSWQDCPPSGRGSEVDSWCERTLWCTDGISLGLFFPKDTAGQAYKFFGPYCGPWF